MERHRLVFRVGVAGLLILVVAALLAIPEGETGDSLDYDRPAASGAFAWNRDSTWFALEEAYVSAVRLGCPSMASQVREGLRAIDHTLAELEQRPVSPSDSLFGRLESAVFSAAPAVGACPDSFPEFLARVTRAREIVKRRSCDWSMSDRTARETLYRTLYGMRAATEELMLQQAPGTGPDLVRGEETPSVTPAADLFGMRVHSGDILVSRGGAPTSALIARGNDFPGNFSHVALVYVDSASGELRLIESHIERGVVLSTPEEYRGDTKLRVMLLRLRPDLAQLRADPWLPHRAARAERDEVVSRHIPYDFAMRHDEHTAQFCSEVASAAYGKYGVQLWMRRSTLTSSGLRTWLGAFGVRYFETQEPSDLEYDPQLDVVAEWRDPESLFKDHLDNAVTEVMLEGAERGERLEYALPMLPVARLVKAYSWTLNQIGRVGPIPEGMSATAALKNRWYSGRHASLTLTLSAKAAEFKARRGYNPPYWRLVEMARTAASDPQ